MFVVNASTEIEAGRSEFEASLGYKENLSQKHHHHTQTDIHTHGNITCLLHILKTQYVTLSLGIRIWNQDVQAPVCFQIFRAIKKVNHWQQFFDNYSKTFLFWKRNVL